MLLDLSQQHECTIINHTLNTPRSVKWRDEREDGKVGSWEAERYGGGKVEGVEVGRWRDGEVEKWAGGSQVPKIHTYDKYGSFCNNLQFCPIFERE